MAADRRFESRKQLRVESGSCVDKESRKYVVTMMMMAEKGRLTMLPG
jgi:hypothetical protein